MTKGTSDSIYSVTATFPDSLVGNNFNYKLVLNGTDWESADNRPFKVGSADTVLQTVWYNNDSVYKPVGKLYKNTVTFKADLSSYLGTNPGQFDPSKDSIVVMGLSNWGGYTVPDADFSGDRTMHPSFQDASIYITTLTFYGPEGDSTAWKLKAYPDENFGNGGGYELGDNRFYHFSTDTVNTIALAPVVPKLTIFAGNIQNSVAITFQVDMSDAVDFHNKQKISPSTISFVGLKGSIPPLGNWVGNWNYSDTVDAPTYVDTISTLKVLNDSGVDGDAKAGDNIWSKTIVMPAGTPAGNFEYKFGLAYPGVDTVNGGSSYLDNEMAPNINHALLLQDGPAISVLNKFGTVDPITGIKQVDKNVPASFELSQNYPNPFNPSTVIKYSVPNAHLVTLKVYNLLGQQVATLINKQQNPGNYEVTFDASKLASGIYFYNLQAGSFNATKKMILVK